MFTTRKIIHLLFCLLLVFSVVGVASAQESEAFGTPSDLLDSLSKGSNPNHVPDDILIQATNFLVGDFADMRIVGGESPPPRIDQVIFGFPAFLGLMIGVSSIFIGIIYKSISAATQKEKINISTTWLLTVAFFLIALLPHPRYSHYSNGMVAALQLGSLGLGSGHYTANWVSRELAEGTPMNINLNIPSEVIFQGNSLAMSLTCAANMYPENALARYSTRDGDRGVINKGDTFSSISNIDRIVFGVNNQGVPGSCGSFRITYDDIDTSDSLGEMHPTRNSEELKRNEEEIGILMGEMYSATYLRHLDRVVDYFESTNRVFFGDRYDSVISNNPHYRYTLAPEFASLSHGSTNREMLGDERSISAYDAAITGHQSLIRSLFADLTASNGAVSAKYLEGTVFKEAFLRNGGTSITQLPASVKISRRMHQHASGQLERGLPTVFIPLLSCAPSLDSGETSLGSSASPFRDMLNRAANDQCELSARAKASMSGFNSIATTSSSGLDFGAIESLNELDRVKASMMGCEGGECSITELSGNAAKFMHQSVRLTIDALTDASGVNNITGDGVINSSGTNDLANVDDILVDVGTAMMQFATIAWGFYTATAVADAAANSNFVGTIPIIGSLVQAATASASFIGEKLWKLSMFFAVMGPTLMVIVPNIANVTYMFGVMSFPIMLYTFTLATVLFAVRGFFPEGQGISGSRWERQLVNLLGIIFYLPFVVFGYLAYEMFLPWFYAIISYTFKTMILIQPNILNFILASVVLIVWQVLITIRVVVWLSHSMIFMTDTVFEKIGAPFNAASQSMNINESVSESKGAVGGAVKQASGGISQGTVDYNNGIKGLGRLGAGANASPMKNSQ